MPEDHASFPDPAPRRAAEEAQEDGRIVSLRVRVLLPLPLPEALDYLAPVGAAAPAPGSFVQVPLGRRSLTGVVWDGNGDGLPPERLKPIAQILPLPVMRVELRR